MWQIGLNFLNGFALALPHRALLAFGGIPAVDARIVAIASIAADREPSAKCFRKITRICHCARGREGDSAEQRSRVRSQRRQEAPCGARRRTGKSPARLETFLTC
jgi:hypothetical protein